MSLKQDVPKEERALQSQQGLSNNSKFSFKKVNRLLNKNDFQNLKSGSRFFISDVLIFYAKDSALDYSRIGIAVSKKYGNAVRRNRFKRLIREYYRHSDFKFISTDFLVLPNLKRIKKENIHYKDIELRIKSSFGKALKKNFKRHNEID